MSLDLTYDQLSPVANEVRAGIVPYNRLISDHHALLKSSLPRFLGALGAVHGASFPDHQLEAVMRVIDAKDIEVDFMFVALESCAPIQLAGLATGAHTFSVEWDAYNNLKIYPVKHGEDMCVDKDIAKLFKEQTRSQTYPDGIGAGTWLMREQIRRSVKNPNWVFAGRDNEHSPDNPPILGLMSKFGSVSGTKQDSAVLQLDGLTEGVRPRWGVDVEIKSLAADRFGLRPSPNNFLATWASKDRRQQMAVVFTKIASTFDGHPVVWTKFKSNGNLPDGGMLKEIVASLLSAGIAEMESPERCWGKPLGLAAQNDLSHIFGYRAPVLHIHANNEEAIVQTLLSMQAEYRQFGHGPMLSGVMNLGNMQNQEKVFGKKLPAATQAQAASLTPEANKPYFDLNVNPSPKPAFLWG